ncbi:MAG: FtsW/RodA/SpoVE family cell cycle protein [Lachnospiraceae bacterium]|nr:FtsW/RodA/SpoVE family cell cycle protein [Lachnospiraceae bacterium]
MVGLSKYFIAIFIVFYTFHCFAIFSYKNDDERKVFYLFQNVLIVLTHVMGFYVLCERGGGSELVILCALEEALFLGFILAYRLLYPKATRLITNNICMLMAIGFVMLARLSNARAVRQFVVAVIGMAFALVIPWLIQKIYFIRYYYWTAGIAGIAVLLIMMTVGTVTKGSKITLTLAGVSFLPSEFVKLLFVFFVAGMLTDEEHRNKVTGRLDRPQLLASMIIAAAHVGILALCKDLGGALIFFIIYMFMLYTATRMPIVLIGGSLGMVLGSVAGYEIFAHVRNRVEAWRDPFADIEGTGYQMAQSLFAIGTGSWFGLGLAAGSPKSIPEVSKDFMFAAISEELGALTALCIILICLSNFLMFMNISMAIGDLYLRLMAVGLAVNYGFQVILTIGGVTKFIPLTGVTLPLVSYGGSSVLVTLMAFAIIQGLYITAHKEEENPDEEYSEEDDRYYDDRDDEDDEDDRRYYKDDEDDEDDRRYYKDDEDDVIYDEDKDRYYDDEEGYEEGYEEDDPEDERNMNNAGYRAGHSKKRSGRHLSERPVREKR